MSNDLKTAVLSVERLAWMADHFFAKNETCVLRGSLGAVGIMQAVEAVIRREYPIEPGVDDAQLWAKRHAALGHGPVTGRAHAWEMVAFSAFSGDYGYAYAGYVCILVAAAVDDLLNTAPEFADTRRVSDERYARRGELTSAQAYDDGDPGSFPIRLIEPVSRGDVS
ncbi:hypothetical protein HJC99_06355 [Candidatus Saccharibacteria bacterium]|nr:hypothetical protein [Candidatus Saccharibacteria bacterium]